MQKIILKIETPQDKVINDDKIACYMIPDTLPSEMIKAIVAFQKMVLVFGNKALEVCKQYNLDGVVKKIDPSKPLKVQAKSLREALKHKTLGLIVPARRHEAMLAGEIEPEFIGFYEAGAHSDDVIQWYNELFLIPCAWVLEKDISTIKELNVDFMIVTAKIFENFGC